MTTFQTAAHFRLDATAPHRERKISSERHPTAASLDTVDENDMPVVPGSRNRAPAKAACAPQLRFASALTSALYVGAVFVVMAAGPETARAASVVPVRSEATAAVAAVPRPAARTARPAMARAQRPAALAPRAPQPPSSPADDHERQHWRHHGVG